MMIAFDQVPTPIPDHTFAPMRTFLLTLTILLAAVLRAQTDPRIFTPYSPAIPAAAAVEPVADPAPDSGHVVIHQSARIQELMKDYASTKQPLKGYRVQIFLGDRNKAEDTRRSFLVKHPDIPAYLSYLAPNFRVRAGDLRTRLEAEHLRDQLKEVFPGCYVVPDDIELPRLADGL